MLLLIEGDRWYPEVPLAFFFCNSCQGLYYNVVITRHWFIYNLVIDLPWVIHKPKQGNALRLLTILTTTTHPGSMSAPSSTPQHTAASQPPILDSTIDPDLFTPSKRGRLLQKTLAASSSGSFLIDTLKITSSQTIMPPVLEGTANLTQLDWSLIKDKDLRRTKEEMQTHIDKLTEFLELAKILADVQNSIIEATQAQLVIQDIHLGKMNETLQVKEKVKDDDCSKLFPQGRGQLLTGDDFHEERVNADTEKRKKEAARALRKESKATQKVRNEAVAKLWKEWNDTHKKAVAKWTET